MGNETNCLFSVKQEPAFLPSFPPRRLTLNSPLYTPMWFLLARRYGGESVCLYILLRRARPFRHFWKGGDPVLTSSTIYLYVYLSLSGASAVPVCLFARVHRSGHRCRSSRFHHCVIRCLRQLLGQR